MATIPKRLSALTDKRADPLEVIFISAWSVFLMSLLLTQTIWYAMDDGNISQILQLARYAAYLICAVVIIYKRKNYSRIVLALIIFGLLALSMLASTNKTQFLYAFLLIAAYDTDSIKIVKTSMFWQMMVLFFTVLFSQIGLIDDYIWDPGTRERHLLGFDWTATAPMIMFYWTLQYVYIRRRKMTVWEFIAIEAVHVLLFIWTDSRYIFALATVFILAAFIGKFYNGRPVKTKGIKYIFCAVPWLLAALSIALHVFYDPDNAFMNRLNTLLTKRLAHGLDAVSQYGFSLFGKKITWVGFSVKPTEEVYNYVDCGYLNVALEYGIIFLILVLVIYTVLIIKAVKAGDNWLLLAALFVLVMAITEPRIMNFSFNPFPLLAFAKIRSAGKACAAHRLRIYETKVA